MQMEQYIRVCLEKNLGINYPIIVSVGPENFKKSWHGKKLVKSNKSKNFFCEIAFLAVLNFFPVQKLIFGHF